MIGREEAVNSPFMWMLSIFQWIYILFKKKRSYIMTYRRRTCGSISYFT